LPSEDLYKKESKSFRVIIVESDNSRLTALLFRLISNLKEVRFGVNLGFEDGELDDIPYGAYDDAERFLEVLPFDMC
jgi:hypothetical protein